MWKIFFYLRAGTSAPKSFLRCQNKNSCAFSVLSCVPRWEALWLLLKSWRLCSKDYFPRPFVFYNGNRTAMNFLARCWGAEKIHCNGWLYHALLHSYYERLHLSKWRKKFEFDQFILDEGMPDSPRPMLGSVLLMILYFYVFKIKKLSNPEVYIYLAGYIRH